jgi:DNA-binding NtrC family response regulator
MGHTSIARYCYEISGFSVITAKSPIEAMSLTSEPIFGKTDVAVIDYHMALMNGCILAEYLKARYPEIKIVLYSGAFDISEEETGSVDVFISMSEGIARLIRQSCGIRPG